MIRQFNPNQFIEHSAICEMKWCSFIYTSAGWSLITEEMRCSRGPLLSAGGGLGANQEEEMILAESSQVKENLPWGRKGERAFQTEAGA